jgi:biotin transport system substrate-specific component
MSFITATAAGATRRRHTMPDLVLTDLANPSRPMIHSRARNLALVVAGATWIALASQVSIPLGFTPVPLSLGSFAVLAAGAALGSRRAATATMLFLAAGLAGAPVFAGGQSGPGLPTIGYAVGYVFAAAAVGFASERGHGRSFGRAFAIMAAGSAIIYLVGVPCLTIVARLSPVDGIARGVTPFLIGDLVKAFTAAAIQTAAYGARPLSDPTRPQGGETPGGTPF